jgi:hypothetical protein
MEKKCKKRKIVRNNNGCILNESKAGKDSIFSVSLPAKRQS